MVTRRKAQGAGQKEATFGNVKETIQVLFPTLKKLHLCTLQNLGMYRESVSTFYDLSVTLGAAPRHVQRVRFWHLKLKSADFLETWWGPPLYFVARIQQNGLPVFSGTTTHSIGAPQPANRSADNHQGYVNDPMHVDLDHGHRDLQLDTGATAPCESNAADKGTLSRGNLLSDFNAAAAPY